MKKNRIGVVVLVCVSAAAGQLLSQVWEQVFGQPGNFSANVPAQAVVNLPAAFQKGFVDFVTVPPLQGENLPRTRLMTVVDMELKKIATYHIDLATGKLQCVSVRDIQEDLLLDQYNAMSPLPSELKAERQRLEAEKTRNKIDKRGESWQ